MIADGGAYASTSAEVTKVATLFANGCYEVANISVDGYAVYTNNIPSGAFRGFGAPQAQFASEIMVTRLAHALGIDPIEIRRRNIYREGGIESTQQPLPPGVSALPVLERCVEEAAHAGAADDGRSAETRQCPSRPSSQSRPPQCACAARHRLRHQERRLLVRLPRAGHRHSRTVGGATIEHAHVRVGAADVGQGAHLALRQIAAEALGLPPDKISMITDDSSRSAQRRQRLGLAHDPDGRASGSRRGAGGAAQVGRGRRAAGRRHRAVPPAGDHARSTR